MKKRNNATRIFAIFMLALIAIFAIALIVFGGYITKVVLLDRQFWFDLSQFSSVNQGIIMLITGMVVGPVTLTLGLYILIEIIYT